MSIAHLFSDAWPGDDLAARVTGTTDRHWFYESGRQSVADVEAALAVARRDFRSFSSILDFGCGCGRILIWLGTLSDTAALHGVDIDAAAIAWVAQNLPYATARVNQPLPPLDYPDGFFDLVYNHSVFSHIDEDLQDRWLSELKRVTRPGGLLLLSVHGEHAFEEFARAAPGRSDDLRRVLQTHGIVFFRDDGWSEGPFPDFYHTSFHAPWYIFAHWGRWFRIRAYIPRGSLAHQDFIVLERLPDDERAPASLAPLTAQEGGAGGDTAPTT